MRNKWQVLDVTSHDPSMANLKALIKRSGNVFHV